MSPPKNSDEPAMSPPKNSDEPAMSPKQGKNRLRDDLQDTVYARKTTKMMKTPLTVLFFANHALGEFKHSFLGFRD
jgi:hypothetical protein